MKNVKRILILTMVIVTLFGITCFADTLIRYGTSHLRPGDTTTTSKCTLKSEVKEFFVNQYVNPANTTKEIFTVNRYDGIWQAKTKVAEIEVSIPKNSNNIYKRIPLVKKEANKEPYVPKGTNVGLVMKNNGSSSFDIKSGELFKYR